jgi:hypothetical protein
MKGKESKTAFIFFHLFFGIGTFQRVTADSNKKNFLGTRRLEGHTRPQSCPRKKSKKTDGHWE